MRIDLNFIRQQADMIRPFCGDDEQTYLDTLDGETDAADILARAVDAEADDAAMVAAIKLRMDEMAARKRRIEDRMAAHRRVIRAVMDAAGLRKAELPLATLSVRDGMVTASIISPDDVPRQLCEQIVTWKPDRAAIKAQLEAGETVPGAELTRGEPILTVRRK